MRLCGVAPKSLGAYTAFSWQWSLGLLGRGLLGRTFFDPLEIGTARAVFVSAGITLVDLQGAVKRRKFSLIPVLRGFALTLLSIVIPAYNEATEFIDQYLNGQFASLLIILVINQPEQEADDSLQHHWNLWRYSGSNH